MSDDRKHPREVKTAAEEVIEQPSQRRRRLVKGALSAPVFLTLQNGSVFANTSNDATVVMSMDDVAKDTQPYDISGQLHILCVDPDGAVTQDSANPNRMDFGNSYQCTDESIGEGDTSGYNTAFTRCNSKGGYIVAGSSHASISC